jgi:hypothetical protein
LFKNRGMGVLGGAGPSGRPLAIAVDFLSKC